MEHAGNTIGFNHGIGSAKDRSMLVLETMAHNTAVFGSMDPREAKRHSKAGTHVRTPCGALTMVTTLIR